jgi:prophage antirepressor-like protein
MSNMLKVFDNTEFGEMGILIVGGKEYFPATECAKFLGYKNPQKAIREHCKGVNEMVTPSAGGEQKKNFITEGNLYRLIIKSKLPNAERFEKWVFEEVLPSIRKHGMYAKDELLDNPDFLLDTVMALKKERDLSKKLLSENNTQKQVIKEMEPKASYYDLVLQSKGVVTTSLVAKDYGLSAVKLNSILKELKVQFKQGKTWLLYQKYAELGYAQSKTYLDTNGYSHMNTQWTQKGRLFIYDLLKNKKEILPIIEKED